MRFDVVCKFRRNENVAPILLGKLNGPLQRFSVSPAQLQNCKADSLQTEFIPVLAEREVISALIGENFGDLLSTIRKQRSNMLFRLLAQSPV